MESEKYMANEFKIKNGLIVSGNINASGIVSASIFNGPLAGTSSFATTTQTASVLSNLSCSINNSGTITINGDFVLSNNSTTLGLTLHQSSIYAEMPNADLYLNTPSGFVDITGNNGIRLNNVVTAPNITGSLFGTASIAKYSPGIVPIGSIVSWLQSLTGTPALPSNFVACSGQTISNPLSPYNGVTLPDLNGNQYFLRGNNTDGSTGGSETHNHTMNLSSWSPNLDSAGGGGFQTTGYGGYVSDVIASSGDSQNTSNENNLPPFYSVIFIIRIY